MKLLSTVCFGAAALISQCVVEAWTITSSDAAKSEDILGAHQEFIKTWTVSGSEPLTSIRFGAAGSVFVDYDSTLIPAATEPPATPSPATLPPVVVANNTGSGSGFRALPTLALEATTTTTETVLAKIVFTGNCTDLLDIFEVIEHDGDLKVHFKNAYYKGYGYVLAQVYLAEKDTLTSVVASGSSSIYLSENVLASSNASAEVELTVSGSSDILVAAPLTDFSLKSLDLKISGEGLIQFNASSLTTSDSLSTKISGSGDIAVLAAGAVEVNNTISTKVSGEGNVYVQADRVNTFALDSKISGSGYIVLSRNGSCVNQDVSISGEGQVATGSIACVDTKIKISGDGSVLVQTSHTLRVPHSVDGSIQYFGAAPQEITDGRPPRPAKKHKRHCHFWWWGDDDDCDDSDDSEDSEDSRDGPKSVTQASVNEYQSYEVRAVPAREPEFLILSIHRNGWSEDPNQHFILTIFGEDIGNTIFGTTQKMAAHVKNHSTASLAAVGSIAGAALVAVGVALHKLKMRNRRREYTPLLQVVTGANSGSTRN